MSEQDPTSVEMTLKDFAEWLLTFPEDITSRKIWYIDISLPYKGKVMLLEESPTGSHVYITDTAVPDDEERG